MCDGECKLWAEFGYVWVFEAAVGESADCAAACWLGWLVAIMTLVLRLRFVH